MFGGIQSAAEPLARALAYVVLVWLIFAPLESIWGVRKNRRSCFRIDLNFATVGVIMTELLLLVVAASALTALHSLAPINIARATAHGGWPARIARLALALLVFELAGYAYHRAAHRFTWLWKLHRIHHSATDMDWLASFRQHPVEILLMTIAQNAPLALLGLPLGEHALLILALKLNTVFVHANLVVPEGPWTRWLATPRFHHRHHSAIPGATVNYASLFPWLDALFGTHSSQAAEQFGLGAGTDSPQTFVQLLLLRSDRGANPAAAEQSAFLSGQTGP